MSKTLRVLHVEDRERDVALLTRYLKRAGYELISERVETAETMKAALQLRDWDVILCDYAMPQFSALGALAVLKQSGLDIPFIIISGTVGEAVAVEAMRAGAHDYLMKDNLVRLSATIERELHEAENRRARTRAEEALRASETELRTLFAAMNDVILVLDAEGRYLKIAPTDPAYQYKPSANLLGKSLGEVFPKEQADFFLTHIRRALHERRTHRVEYCLQVGEKAVWFDGSVSPMTDHSVIWIARDITERKQAEERIRQSERQMAEAQQLAHVGSWNWDLANNVLNWSDEHYHILGLDPKEFDPTYEKVIAEHVFPDDRDLVRSVIDGMLENHEPFSCHYRVQRPDGQVRVVHSQGSLLCDDQGSPIRMFGTVQDVTERKRAEEERERLAAEIEKQRERLDNIVGSVPGVVWEAWGQPDDASQRINFVSDYVETMLGYRVDEWVSTPDFWLTIVHPSDRDRAGELSAAAFAAGRPVTMEFRWLAKDGRAIWVESNFVAIKDDQGQPVGLRGVTTDISERKRAEAIASRRSIHALFRADVSAALASSTSSLRDTLHLCVEAMVFHLNAAFARVWTFNREHSVLELQASAGLYTHLDGAHARVPLGSFKIGRIAESRMPHISNNVLNDPEVSDKAWAEREQIVAFAGYPLIVEERLIGVMAMFSREVLEDDTLDALDSVADIVSQGIERKRAEEALSESEQRYRDLVENAHDIIYSHDLEGNYTSMNKAGTVITGYTLDKALKLNLAQTVAPEYVARAREMLKRKLAGEPVTAYEMEIIAENGRRITVEANTKLVYQDGVAVGVQGIARDITERKVLEEQLRQSQKMEAIGQLAGGVAHDFNNLLTAINGYSSLALRRADEDDAIKGYLEEINKAGERAANLTRQLLAFGRKQMLQPVALNLNDVVADLNKMLRRLIGEDIRLTAKFEPALKKIKADPGQIEQVLVNLVVNARDAMPQGGTLTIETANVELDEDYAARHVGIHPGKYVMLAVSDNGTGMNEETRARIFEPFFTTKEKGKGTGLGLSTVYGIVKQSGGNIWVYSEPNQGTSFKVYLPQLESEIETEKKSSREEEISGGTETVLLVEDEDVVRRLAKDILEGAGYKVLSANGGMEAAGLCAAGQKEIDLLLTDVVMPETSGKEVAERVSKLVPGIKVLFMSGYTDEAIVHHGVLDSNVEFIQKPFTPVALAKKVRQVLDSNGHLQRT